MNWLAAHAGDVMGWIAMATNLWGNLAIAKKIAVGWPIRLISNAAWILYSVDAMTMPLLANHITFAAINIYGWWKWRQEELRERATAIRI